MDPIEEAQKITFKRILESKIDYKQASIVKSLGIIIILVIIPQALLQKELSYWILFLFILGIALWVADFYWFKYKYLWRVKYLIERLLIYPFKRVMGFSIPTKEFMAKLKNDYLLPDGGSFFHDISFDLPLHYRNDDGNKVIRKPYVLIKIKPRDYLPWIDGLYYLLANDLSKIGFIPIVYIYDFPYQLARPKDSMENHSMGSLVVESGYDVQTTLKKNVKKNRKHILMLCGAAVKIRHGSSFFKGYSKAHNFHHFLYGKAFPTFINGLNNHFKDFDVSTLDGEYKSNKELFYKLIGYPTMLVAESLAKERPLLIVQWDGRSDKLIAEDKFGTAIPALKTKTLRKENGKPIEVHNSYHLTDSSEVLERKIKLNYEQYGGRKVLEYVCYLLLYRDNRDIIAWRSFVTKEVDGKAILSVVSGMRNFLPPNKAELASAYHTFLCSDHEDLESVRKNALELAGADECYLKYIFWTGMIQFKVNYGIESNN